jgi:hypothetical protein
MREICEYPTKVGIQRVTFYGGDIKMNYWDISLNRKEGKLPKFNFLLKSNSNRVEKVDTIAGGELIYHLRHFGCEFN